ncbi:MAG: hypothetical protein FJZ58_08455, partial [Chlamydiae bacterium]|nr:hypothetical protein [Chlamydiota bacterium]
EEDLIRLAKLSLGNLVITCLEYGKLRKECNLASLVTCLNPQEADTLRSHGKSLIFLCAHQANWELFFLEGTSRMPGVAIGQPIQNRKLYQWILSIRQKYQGKIVLPKEAVKEGLRALKQGKFFGIVGDQGMPGSGFSSSFLGREAWTSPLPALLAYRSGTPLLTATMVRKLGCYEITYSTPLWPDTTKPLEEEIPRLMKEALRPIEESIKQYPEQWLWSHNRWKQQPPGRLKRSYRFDAIAVVLPQEEKAWCDLSSHLEIFRILYPTELLVFFTPRSIQNLVQAEEQLYAGKLCVKDFRPKLVLNFSDNQGLAKQFPSAFRIVTKKTLCKETGLELDTSISLILKEAALLSHAH